MSDLLDRRVEVLMSSEDGMLVRDKCDRGCAPTSDGCPEVGSFDRGRPWTSMMRAMTVAAPGQVTRTKAPRVMLVAFGVPVMLYLVVHYVVVAWLTVDVVSRLDVLATRMFTVAGIDVRLWWLVSALIIVLAIGAPMLCVTAESSLSAVDMAFGAVVTHVPAIVGAWVLVWSGFSDPEHGFGDFVGNTFWTVVFGGLIGGSCVVIGHGAYVVGLNLKGHN
jgi:hypothetical protein